MPFFHEGINNFFLPCAFQALHPAAGGRLSLGGEAGLLRTQLLWSYRTGARGRTEAAGVAVAATRAAGGSGGVGAANVFERAAAR
eukprot:SAG31_NODE_2441_length_5684_cov_6.528021_4_plen_84_part_01